MSMCAENVYNAVPDSFAVKPSAEVVGVIGVVGVVGVVGIAR